VTVQDASGREQSPPSGRPLSLTIAAWAFILVGAGGILKDVLPLGELLPRIC
jgi:hypothetical protein